MATLPGGFIVRQYSAFQALVLSFFSRDLYKDIARNWRGVGLRYLLLLLALSWIPVLVKAQIGLHSFAKHEFPQAIQEFPAITIKNGVVSSPVQQPFTIDDKKTGKPIFVLDTTGKITSIDETPAIILLTTNKLIYRDPNQSQVRIVDLSKTQYFYIDQAKIQGWMNAFSTWFAVAAFPLALLGSFIYRLIQILIYALIGMAFAAMFKVKLEFPTLMRIAAVAITPVVAADTLVWLTGMNIPAWSLICLAAALGYIAFAVKANYDPTIEQTPGFPIGQPGYPPPTFQPGNLPGGAQVPPFPQVPPFQPLPPMPPPTSTPPR
jgi:hypothetical protein